MSGPRSPRRPARLAATSVALLLVLAACRSSIGSSPAVSSSPDGASGIVAQVASYQLVAGRPGRLLVALLSADNRWVSFGSLPLHFQYIGPSSSAAPAQASATPAMADGTAAFVAIPGTPPGDGPPRLTVPADGRGLYVIEDITFPTPGYWQLTAGGALADGTAVEADAAFEVLSEPIVLDVGDPAPHSDNPVLGDDSVPLAAIDSRAAVEETVPDAELHQTSIADALDAHEPALVVFSTPVYCVSQFCGPVTDMVSDLAADYADRAAFIHVEIYRDFQANAVNETALEWLSTPEGDLREPWVFLVGGDGRIVASWDTMVARSEIEPYLQALPAFHAPADG